MRGRVTLLGLPSTWIVRVLLLAGLVGFALSVFLRSAGPAPWLDAGLYNVPFVAAAAACFLHREGERLAWRTLGAGILIYTAANVYSTLWLNNLDDPPYPSFADAGWIAFYLLAYASQVILARSRIAGFGWSNWLDGAIAGLAGAALGAALLLGPIIADTSGSVLVVVTNLAYPIVDFLLVVLIIALSVATERAIERRVLLLSAGLCAFAVGDTLFLFQAAENAYVEGGPIDLSWPSAIVLIGLAATLRTAPVAAVRRQRVRVALPIVFGAVALGVLADAAFRPVPTPAVLAALAALLLILVRVTTAFRHLNDLAIARAEARTDELTELANRRHFYACLDEAIERARPFCVLIADLDRFKEVNDSLGHHIGDELLRTVAPRLAAAAGQTTTTARIGGDEFGLIVEGEMEVGVEAATAIHAALATPIALDDLDLVIGASVGIAVWPEHGQETSALVRTADVAMYTAKRSGGGTQVYVAVADPNSRARLGLTDELRRAIRDGNLVLHYQPKVEVATGLIQGVEALVRWNHATRGLIPPDQFIGIAEQTGLIRPLTTAVLDLALDQARRWDEAGHPLPIAVNVPAYSFNDNRLRDEVAASLIRHGVPGRLLELEITEHTLMVDPVRARQVIAEFARLDVRIAIDDFGTGHSSLAYLRDLAVTSVKLDRSFVIGVDDNPNAAAIVRATVDLAHALGLGFVAEGVETAAAMTLLRSYGCDYAQGYYLTRPLPEHELELWIDAWSSPAAA